MAYHQMWEKKQVAEKRKSDRDAATLGKEGKKELAIIKSKELQEAITHLETILLHTLNVDDKVDWSILLDRKKFPDKKPSSKKFVKKIPSKQKPTQIPPEPKKTATKYRADLGFFDKLFSSSRKRKEAETENLFSNDHKDWAKKKAEILHGNAQIEPDYLNTLAKWESEKQNYEKSLADKLEKWKLKKHKYLKKQKEFNQKILDKKKDYENRDPGALSDYCEMVLTNSEYPDYFPQEWDLDYNAETKVLIVDYSLPTIESIPTTTSMKYVVSRNEFSEAKMSNAALNKLYDSLLYQISLRTVHELYEADVVNAIESIVFNGWVDSIDKATGLNANACIMSLQASKVEFLAINLEKVDPKSCFKQLKGVGSSKLHGLSPVAPIININKEDRRFISAYDVADGMEESDNLAMMDWQDFENLIREIFEKEFSSSGGEVKITQASRDGGVDAIAFDPDPIRGGKIVIQAKRYTNVVGVSSVRDLFGTTVNEGAIKGILITTADYGPDAYEFAKGKPLTLLNGSNLLHLLEKHGHKAKIDIREAKQFFAEQKHT